MPSRLPFMVNLSKPDRSRFPRVPETLAADPWFNTRLALLLLMLSVAPAPVIVFVRFLATPTSPGVPTIRPPVPVRFRVWPDAIRVVWVLLLLPYCSEPMVPADKPSTTLLILEAVGTAAVS